MGRLIILLLTFSVCLHSCRSGRVLREGSNECVFIPGTKSVLVSQELIGLADTTASYLSIDYLEHPEHKPPPAGMVHLLSSDQQRIVILPVDSFITRSVSLIADDYELKVSCVGYSTLDTLIQLQKGEVWHMKIFMGNAQGFKTIEKR